MEEELAIRVIPAERSVMLLQVSKTMRTAMQRVSPPAMIKVKEGQTFLTESVKNAMLDEMVQNHNYQPIQRKDRN